LQPKNHPGLLKVSNYEEVGFSIRGKDLNAETLLFLTTVHSMKIYSINMNWGGGINICWEYSRVTDSSQISEGVQIFFADFQGDLSIFINYVQNAFKSV